MTEDNKPKTDHIMMFKEMMDAQKHQDNIYQLYQENIEQINEPSKIEYFKYNAREYFRFLVNATLITGHIIKVVICLLLLVYLSYDNIMPNLLQIKYLLQYLLISSIGYLIVTSATQSMLMPLTAIAVSIVSDMLLQNVTFLIKIEPLIMQYLLAAGICGVCVAVFFRPSIKF